MRRHQIGARVNFDTDIIVRLYWDDLDVVNQGTRVAYPSDGVSHFRVWHDNALITAMYTVILFGMLPRIPSSLVDSRRIEHSSLKKRLGAKK